MDNKLKITQNITLESLNPHNFHLKNDYINNLLSTAFIILPIVAEHVTGIEVTKGFLSRSYLRSPSRDIKISHVVYKHSIGLALELTWDNWTYEEALIVAEDIYERASDNDEKVMLVINEKQRTLYIGRGFKVSSILEDADGKERIIKLHFLDNFIH